MPTVAPDSLSVTTQTEGAAQTPYIASTIFSARIDFSQNIGVESQGGVGRQISPVACKSRKNLSEAESQAIRRLQIRGISSVIRPPSYRIGWQPNNERMAFQDWAPDSRKSRSVPLSRNAPFQES